MRPIQANFKRMQATPFTLPEKRYAGASQGALSLLIQSIETMSAESSKTKLDRTVAQAHAARAEREQGYRARALKLYPWICGRCAREFSRENLRELTVHHRDHNHDNNPADGSNWELLCIYCHDNEHSRHTDSTGAELTTEKQVAEATYNPFAELSSMLEKKK